MGNSLSEIFDKIAARKEKFVEIEGKKLLIVERRQKNFEEQSRSECITFTCPTQ